MLILLLSCFYTDTMLAVFEYFSSAEQVTATGNPICVQIRHGGSTELGILATCDDARFMYRDIGDRQWTVKRQCLIALLPVIAAASVTSAIQRQRHRHIAITAGFALGSYAIMYGLFRHSARKALIFPTCFPIGEAAERSNDTPVVNISFGLKFPSRYYERNDTMQRLHGFLWNIAPITHTHWMPIDHSLQPLVITSERHQEDRISTVWGSLPYQQIDADQHLFSLNQCIMTYSFITEQWAKDTLCSSNTPAPFTAPLRMPGTLGAKLFDSRQAVDVAAQFGITLTQPLYWPEFIHDRGLFCCEIKKDGLLQAVICRHNPDSYPDALPLLHLQCDLTSPPACVIGPDDRRVQAVEDYAEFMSLRLPIPPPERYKDNITEQLYHAALRAFALCDGLQNVPVNSNVHYYTLPPGAQEQIIINRQTSRARIRNTVIPFRGTFDWDTIRAAYPTFQAALAAVQARIPTVRVPFHQDPAIPMIMPRTAGFYLTGTYGAQRVEHELSLDREVPALSIPLYPAADLSCNQIQLVSILKKNGQKSMILCERRTGDAHQNNLDTNFDLGCHLVGYETKEERNSTEAIAFWKDPRYVYETSTTFNTNTDTFAEAMGGSLSWPVPDVYNAKKERQRLHSALALFLLHHAGIDSYRFIHLPRWLRAAVSVHGSIDEERNAITEYGVLGNLHFSHYAFDWATVQRRYPTIETALAAQQQRINRWLIPAGGIELIELACSWSSARHGGTLAHRIWQDFAALVPNRLPPGLSLTYFLPRVTGYSITTTHDKEGNYKRLNVNPGHCADAAFMWRIIGKQYAAEEEACLCLLCEQGTDMLSYNALLGERNVTNIVMDYLDFQQQRAELFRRSCPT